MEIRSTPPLELLFNDICAAIHEKDGKADGIAANDFPTRIRALQVCNANVFGVCWDYDQKSPALVRLTPGNDPNSLVTVSIQEEPVAAVGTTAGSSPFDAFMPWAGMEEYNIINGAVSHKKDSPQFSRTDWDTVVFIPTFWYKCVDDPENKKRYWYVSDHALKGLEVHPGSGCYIGKYETGSTNQSISGIRPTVNTALGNFRESALAKGPKWRLCDYKSYCAVALLALVEFATWDLGHTIGPGYVVSDIAKTGGTDSMAYHTGAAGPGQNFPMQYRGIENLYGNVWKVQDGVLFKRTQIYVCEVPRNYKDEPDENYKNLSFQVPASHGHISEIGFDPSAPWAFLAKSSGGTVTTYTTDSYFYSPNSTSLCATGDIYHGYSSGISALAVYFSAQSGDVQFGSRLLFE